MTELISQSEHIARKTYHCNAYECIISGQTDGIFDYAELRQIVKVRRQKGMILPGQRYIRQVQVDSGDIGVYRAFPEMDAICRNYDLFDGG